ncbi:hypothetical protein CPB86DRAFT_686709, partial [Serendipita vermifera]
HKVGCITGDNAGNNGTMTEAIGQILMLRGIPFSPAQNYIRDLLSVIADDPVKRCRDLVNAIRSTSQRREDFRRTTEAGIKNGTLSGKPLELIRDMPVRWSSTFSMIDRFLLMAKAVDLFLTHPHNREMLLKYGMTEMHLSILNHIRLVLLIFHSVQELLSSERTPTLTVTLPAYEACLKALHDVVEGNYFPHLNHAIHAAIDKIEKYVQIARKNHIYGMSMFINPSCKKEWMMMH